ncbi:hypothetical protein Tco_0439630 [Tanacetum coccineum]
MSTKVHQAAETVTTSNVLDLLFGPLFDEYFNRENQVVLKSSAVTTTDASNKRQQPDSTSSTSTLATTVTANGNFNLPNTTNSWTTKPDKGDVLDIPKTHGCTLTLKTECLIGGGPDPRPQSKRTDVENKEGSSTKANTFRATSNNSKVRTVKEVTGNLGQEGRNRTPMRTISISLGHVRKEILSHYGSGTLVFRGLGCPAMSKHTTEAEIRKINLRKKLSSAKKHIKDPVEIHHIKQRDGESTEDFMERYKAEVLDVEGAPECMRISDLLHGNKHPGLIKRLYERIPRSVDEMYRMTTSFLQGEVSNRSKKVFFIMENTSEGGDKTDFMKGFKKSKRRISSRVIPMDCAMISGSSIQSPAHRLNIEKDISRLGQRREDRQERNKGNSRRGGKLRGRWNNEGRKSLSQLDYLIRLEIDERWSPCGLLFKMFLGRIHNKGLPPD